IGYDTPDFVASGANYFDEVYGYLGRLDRYTWKLVGKKEVYVPYNNNRFFAAGSEKAFVPFHTNPDAVRWELHRVWVVEANLAPGKRHVVPKRRFYIEEDSWLAVLYEGWDGQGQLWRYDQSAPINVYELPGIIPLSWGVINLQTGARTCSGVLNEAAVQCEMVPYKPDSFYSPD